VLNADLGPEFLAEISGQLSLASCTVFGGITVGTGFSGYRELFGLPDSPLIV
jgi:hypothetical protein